MEKRPAITQERENVEPIDFVDSDNNVRTGPRGLVPLKTIRQGQVIWEAEES